ncbi:MAG: type IV pilus secretin PilQ [Thermodesulfobacteriota bacterium]
MGKKPIQGTRAIALLVYLALGSLFLGGCATPSAHQTPPGGAMVPLIESMKVNPSLERTVLEVSGTMAMPYTAFRLMDPPRIVLDIQGGVGKDLPPLSRVNQGSIREVQFEKGGGGGLTGTRMVIGLFMPVEYEVKAEGEKIRVVLSHKPFLGQASAGAGETAAPVQKNPANNPGAPVQDPSEPRIFFEPKSTGLNQVMGIDFMMLDRGRSRIVVSTDKKGVYDLERKGANTLLLKLSKANIPPQLLREIDSSQFAGVVERIRPAYSQSEKQVSLAILLKEMVPFHVDQKEKGITIEFGPTTVKPAEKKIVPLQLTQAQPPGPAPAAPAQKAAAPGVPAPGRGEVPGGERRGYTGTPMTMDFVNADVTNILRLIGEVSNLNIVWGPEVRGTVSMRLKNVPWDQALDLVLANNNLAKREEGNVIWVTTKAQMAQVEAEERRKREDKQREIDDQIKREKAEEKKEEMKTAYLTVNYKDVNNIRDIIDKTVKSPEGKITVDTQTKTIILFDRVSKLAEATALKERLDQATPQVMIEARIVEANTSFSRSLGVNWSFDQQIRRNPATTWTGAPAWAVDNVTASYPTGSKLYAPTFATNFGAQAFPGPNLGLVFTKLSRGGLTGTLIDAQLALAETEGKTRTLSAPKVVTRDTVKATIQQGTKIVIPAGTDANGNRTYQQVDASLKLEVKPQITPNNMVIMEVVVKDDQPDYANAQGENIPINTKEASTTMMVATGDTVVIGGIYKETEGDTTAGLPGLHRIPLLGWLFKANSRNLTRVELLIFLTPTVLTTT